MCYQDQLVKMGAAMGFIFAMLVVGRWACIASSDHKVRGSWKISLELVMPFFCTLEMAVWRESFGGIARCGGRIQNLAVHRRYFQDRWCSSCQRAAHFAPCEASLRNCQNKAYMIAVGRFAKRCVFRCVRSVLNLTASNLCGDTPDINAIALMNFFVFFLGHLWS